MIAVGADILVYAQIEGDYSQLANALREKDTDWRTTGLYLHEILNLPATNGAAC